MDPYAFKREFDPLFASTLGARLSAAEGLLPLPGPVLGALRAGVAVAGGGGKRLRPLLAAAAFAGDWHGIAPQLTGIELLHAFALVHDDVMDRAHLRHGVPTVHRAVRLLLEARGRQGDRLREEADAQAVLVGDVLFGWAHEEFGTFGADVSEVERQGARDRFGTLITEVCIGQMLDIDVLSDASATSATITMKNRFKTARYSCVRPIAIGLTLAGRTDDPFAVRFGEALGLAFQLQDDLLDVVSTEAELQKEVLADVAAGQRTALTQFVEERGSEADRAELARLRAGTVPPEAARELFRRSGAVANARRGITGYLGEARAAAAGRPEGWEPLIDFVEGRAS